MSSKGVGDSWQLVLLNSSEQLATGLAGAMTVYGIIQERLATKLINVIPYKTLTMMGRYRWEGIQYLLLLLLHSSSYTPPPPPPPPPPSPSPAPSYY